MKNKKLYIPLVIFITIFCVGMAKGFYKTYKSDEILINEIEASLKEHCNCESISKDMYSKGIQYSKRDGFSVEKVSFNLKNCQFLSIEDEGKRIANFLKHDVENLKQFNLITLDVISSDRHDTITIKNGELED